MAEAEITQLSEVQRNRIAGLNPRPTGPIGFGGERRAGTVGRQNPARATRKKKKAKRVGGRPSPELRRLFREKLKESGLKEKDARDLGIELASAEEVAALAPNFERRGGLIIRHYNARGREIKSVLTVRYLEPPSGFGLYAKNPRRYTRPRGTPPKAYLPRVWIDWRRVIEDPKEPILITEGELKAACLAKHGFTALAVPGVNGWRSRRRHIDLLPELKDFQWAGRPVYLCFDSDITHKPEVRRALHALARELIQRGAEVKEIALPDLDDLDKTGADDFLVREDRDALRDLMREARPAIVVDEHNLTVDTCLDWANEHLAVISLGGKTRILRETVDPDSMLPTDEFLTCNDALRFYQNRGWKGDNGRHREAIQHWLQHPKRREYDGITFVPGEPKTVRADGGEPFYNLWWGYAVEPEPGNWSTFDDHLRSNVCRDDEDLYRWLVGWMAHIVQRPGDKTGVAVALQGLKGCGKSKVGECFGGLFHPAHYLTIAQEEHLLGRFNAHQAGKIIVQAEEAFWAGSKKAESVLKDLITGHTVLLERKGIDAVPVRNHANLLITSNEDWVVPTSWDERRFAVFEVGADRTQDQKYFGEIDREFANGGAEGFLHHLLSLDLDLRTYPNPKRAPRTTGLAKQKLRSLDALGNFWHEVLLQGTIGQQWDDEWPDAVPVDVFKDLYQAHQRETRTKKRGPTDSRDIGKKLRELCPEITTTKASQNLEGRRPRVFRVPPLDRCRRAFEEHLGSRFNWETGEPV